MNKQYVLLQVSKFLLCFKFLTCQVVYSDVLVGFVKATVSDRKLSVVIFLIDTQSVLLKGARHNIVSVLPLNSSGCYSAITK